MRIVVIGGGVVGTTTAYWLARDGHEITLLERSAELAAEGSFANGGMLHASHGEPWNSPQAIRQLLAWIGREDSPLLLRPGRLPWLLRWGAAFLRNSTPARHHAAALANTRLARYSQALMADIRADADPSYAAARSGIAKLFWNAKDLAAAVRFSDVLQEIGVPYRRWSTAELVRHEPALAANAHRLAGALYYPDDETGDTCLFTRGLGDHCRRIGVTIRTGTPVRRLERSGKRIAAVVTEDDRLVPDQVVLASGPEAPRLTRPLGLRLPIEPVKGYSVTIDGRGIDGLPRLPLIDDRHKVVATPLGERLRAAGTAEFTGFDTSINERRIQLLLAQLGAILPQHAARLPTAPRTDWACLRAMTPDGVPIIGPSPIENLWLNVGAGHMGWTLAAGMGRLLADLLAGRPPALASAPYSFERLSPRSAG
jgi:D-amino-acid dehydrogenase